MIVRNAIKNFLGLSLPLGAAVFTIPVLIRHLGDERFGLLTLVWAVVSYFGLFDLGLGRALTQQLSVAFAREEHGLVGSLVRTSLVVMFALGILAGVVVWIGAPWGVSLLKGVSDPVDTVAALHAMAFAMPFIVLTSGLRGIMEARFSFGVLNLIRVPMGLFTFVGPLVVVLWWSDKLAPIAWVLCFGRVVACAAHAWFVRGDILGRAHNARFDAATLKDLLASGGWMSVSNIVSPLMAYADRFIIGAIISASMVAYYTTPNEMITKIWIIPGALTAVLFPQFAQDITRNQTTAWKLLQKSVSAIFVVTFPIALALSLFAHEILALWVGKDFANHSAPVLQIFAIGILINCMAHVPFTLIQSANKAHITAVIHCLIFPIFILVIWQATKSYGLEGAAVSWLLRIVFDALLMFYFSARIMKHSIVKDIRPRAILIVAVIAAIFSGAFIELSEIRVIIFVVGIIFTAIIARHLTQDMKSISPFIRPLKNT